MRPHSKIRKTIKWAGAVATVLLGVVWIGSALWNIGWYSRNSSCAVCAGGQFTVVEYLEDRPLIGPPGWRHEANRFPFKWGAKWEKMIWVRAISIPLWTPLLLVVVATAAAWRLDALARRRARIGL